MPKDKRAKIYIHTSIVCIFIYIFIYSKRKGGRALFKMAARSLVCIELFESGFWWLRDGAWLLVSAMQNIVAKMRKDRLKCEMKKESQEDCAEQGYIT